MGKLKACPEPRRRVEGLRFFGVVLFLMFLSACAAPTVTPTAFVPPADTSTPRVILPTLTITPTPTATASPSPTSENVVAIQFPAPGLIHDLRWSPDGGALVIAAGTDIHTYNFHDNMREMYVIRLGIWTERLAFFDMPATLLGAALKDGSVRFWDWLTGKELCKFTAHTKGANSLAFQPHGTLLATTGTDIISRTWDISSVLAGGCKVKPVGQLIGSSFTAPDVTFSADGASFALVDIKDIYLRESQTRKLIAVLHGDLAIFDIALSADGHWLAAAQNNATVTLWDLTAKPKPTSTLLHLPKGQFYTWRVDFSADGSLLAGATSGGELLVWQIPSLQPVFSRSLGHPISGLAFNPSTSALTVGTLNGSVYVYTVK